MRTLLLYNPLSGRRVRAGSDTLRTIGDLLRQHGHTVAVEATQAAGSAADQARAAVAAGFDTIVACGGDGTVHDILQGIADARRPLGAPCPALGVLPMGSANALARHLGLSMSPLEAARQLLTYEPRLIPVGQVEWTGGSRYFLVMAGAGPDGALVYRMLPGAKHRLGRLAYYVRAAWLFASQRFAPFELTWTEAGASGRGSVRAVGTMAVRIDDLGGLFSRLTPEAGVHHPYLHLIAVRGPAWISLPAWFTANWLGLGSSNPFVEAIHVQEFTCTPAPGEVVHVQADGEWIGTAPMRVHLIPDAVRLLMPVDSSASR